MFNLELGLLVLGKERSHGENVSSRQSNRFCSSTVLSGAAQTGRSSGFLCLPPQTEQSAEFPQAADEVLVEMSKLLSLPDSFSAEEESPLPGGNSGLLVCRKMKEDKDRQQALRRSEKAWRKFRSSPERLSSGNRRLVKVLTEQNCRTLRFPTARNFFIANWKQGSRRNGMVMFRHETHARASGPAFFIIDKWDGRKRKPE